MELLKSYTLKETWDFIFYILKKEHDDDLWLFYLHKVEPSISFNDFKNQQVKESKAKKGLTEEEEAAQIEWSKKFIKPINKGGE